MAPNIDDYLVFLRENASEIKKLGKEWGMDEKEILNCVDEVLSQSPNSENKGNTPMNWARKLWRVFLFFMKASVCAVLALVAAMTILCFVISYHSPSAEYISKMIQPHAYPVMRFFRLAALPFHDVTNITQFYETECIINNPFYVGEAIDCTPCSIFKKVKEADANTFPADKLAAYIGADKPVLLKKTYDRNITYADLRKLYQENKGSFDEDGGDFTSSDPTVPDLSMLFGEDQGDYLNSSNTLKISWKLTSMETTKAVRDMFPHPSFMPKDVKMIVDKHILIDSPKTGTYELPEVIGPVILYTQAEGRRRVLLRPPRDCKSMCSSLLVVVEAGDCLLYSDDVYKLFLSTNGDTVSIGYVTQLMP